MEFRGITFDLKPTRASDAERMENADKTLGKSWGTLNVEKLGAGAAILAMCNLYDDYFAAPAQMGDHVFARMLTLPDGTDFPGFSSGWGDGAYPVVSLYDSRGQMLALYADFIGNDQTEDYILPPPCQTAGT